MSEREAIFGVTGVGCGIIIAVATTAAFSIDRLPLLILADVLITAGFVATLLRRRRHTADERE